MKADRLSGAMTISSQVLFGALLSLGSWQSAANGASALATVALVLAILIPARSRTDSADAAAAPVFPRLGAGSFLCFALMSVSGLRFGEEVLFPYTGLFFAVGIGAATLVDAALPALRRRSLRYANGRSLALGLGYAISAVLHQALFPRPGYLYFGVGGLVIVSLVDAGSGMLSAARSRHMALSFALVFLCSPSFTAVAAEGSTDEETFAALFGGEAGAESRSASPDDLLSVSAIEIDAGGFFEPAYIRSFVREFSVGDRLTRGELEGAIALIRERMAFSHRFYGPVVSYRTASAEENAPGAAPVAVTIRAGDGFWWDFNFEPYDLSVGYLNLFRAGKELRLVAGANTQTIGYRDPAVGNGRRYLAVGASHRVEKDANTADTPYLYESLSGQGEAGVSFGDDVRLGIGGAYAVYRAASAYFLYPGYDPPESDALALLGFPDGPDAYEGVAAFALRASVGAYSYRRRGGAKARFEGAAEALLPQAETSGLMFKTAAAGDLRFDAPRLLRLTLSGRIEYFPRSLAGSGIPEPLWADIDEGRLPTGVVSGEMASLSRATVGLDPVAVIGLGFARLDLIPEVFYEITAVRFDAYGAEPRWAQNVGVLLKGAFSPPVNRIFSLGVAVRLPGGSAGPGAVADRGPAAALFLEIE